MGTGSFPGLMRPGGATPFRAEVKEIGQLYLCSLSELSWPVIGCYLNLTYIYVIH